MLFDPNVIDRLVAKHTLKDHISDIQEIQNKYEEMIHLFNVYWAYLFEFCGITVELNLSKKMKKNRAA